MAILSGELSSLNLAAVLQMLQRSCSSGRLRVESDLGTATFGLHKGLVMWATASVGYRMGEALAAQRALTPDALDAALNAQRKARRRQPLGAILVNLGFMSREAVAVEVEAQILRVLREVLNWHSGSYELEPSDHQRAATLRPRTCQIDQLLLAATTAA